MLRFEQPRKLFSRMLRVSSLAALETPLGSFMKYRPHPHSDLNRLGLWHVNRSGLWHVPQDFDKPRFTPLGLSPGTIYLLTLPPLVKSSLTALMTILNCPTATLVYIRSVRIVEQMKLRKQKETHVNKEIR